MDNTTLGALAVRWCHERQRTGQIGRLTADANRRHLASFATSYGRRPLDQLGHAAVVRWLTDMERRGYAASTRSVHLSTVRTFARWCVQHGHVPRDWTTAAPRVRRARQVPRDLTNDHVGAIVDACGDARARAVVWLMFGSGLRCVEVSRLQVDDVDRASRLLFVTGKGGHQRYVPCPPPTLAAVDEYLAGAGHRSGALIRPQRGETISPSRISHLVGDAIRAAGVKIRLGDGRTAHGLRAAAASDLYDACGDPRIVQQFLGHRHLQTTSIYLRRAEQEHVRVAVEGRFAA